MAVDAPGIQFDESSQSLNGFCILESVDPRLSETKACSLNQVLANTPESFDLNSVFAQFRTEFVHPFSLPLRDGPQRWPSSEG